MSSDFIPEDVSRFILESIDSVAQMEALILVRSQPDHKWTASDLAKRLYIREEETTELLSRLCASGFLIVDKGEERSVYCYRPSSVELRALADRLSEVYAKHLVPVTNLIHSKPKTRVQEFADAFKLRRDK